jgi:hypothetical protein
VHCNIAAAWRDNHQRCCHMIAIIPRSQEKRAGALLRPVKSILGEDRHDGRIFVHRNKSLGNAQNAALQ